MPKFKIGLVLDTSLDPLDGVQQYVVAIGEWLRAEGHDVHYLVGETTRRQLPNIHSLARNIGVTFNGNKTTIPLPTSRRRLQRFVDAQQFDILHVQTPHHPLLAQRLVLAAGPRTVILGTFHILPYNALARLATRLLGVWLRPSLKRFDAMLAVSSSAADFERQCFGLPATVLPNVVDYAVFHEAEPFERYQDNVRTIVFLGRLVERKGCLVLLRAIAKLAQGSEIPPFRVVICGRGHLEDSLKRFVRANGLMDIVEFAGFVTEIDKPRYYASADIVALPSSGGESFGIVLLEAMASGRAAVLGGDNPGYRTVLAPRPELLFKPTDVDVLAQKIELLLRDHAARSELAEWGETYTQDFDVNVVGRKLVSLYENLYASKNVR